MRILWPHNFDPNKLNSGVFMYQMADGIRKMGVDVQLEFLGNLRSVKNIFQAKNHLVKIAPNFDLVHAQFGSACSYATSFINNIPKLMTIRGSDWNIYSKSLGFTYFHSRLAHAMTSYSVGDFDMVIAVSNSIKQEIFAKFPQIDCKVLPSPVNLNRFYPKNRVLLRRSFGFSNNDEKWILFTSTSISKPIKGFKLALAVIEILKKKNKSIRFRLANNIPHECISDFVAACDLIICTSTSEGWPNAVKEALACNIPFVSTDVSDLSLIANQESSCKICPPNPQIFADAILDTLSHPPDYNLRQYVEDMDIEQTSRKLLDLYKKILD